MYQRYELKFRRGKNRKLTAQRSNSNTVWFNFQTYIYIYIYIVLEIDWEAYNLMQGISLQQENHNVRYTTLLQWLCDRGLYHMDTQSLVHASTE